MTVATADHLRRLPKVELHCHVEGAARASTIRDLAVKNGVTFPVEDPADLYRFTSLNQFLEIYDVVCATLVTADDFRRITYEALEDGARAGVRYRGAAGPPQPGVRRAAVGVRPSGSRQQRPHHLGGGNQDGQA